MSYIRYTCLLVLLASLFAGLCQTAHAQTEFPPAYNNQAHYAVGDLVTDYGNIYRCEAAVTKPYLDPSKTYANWELFYVRSSTTITIGDGQTFPDLATAWKYVQNARIAEAAYLHLSIVTTSGKLNESFSAPLSLDHNSGSQISIIGDNSSNITLYFSSSNGFTIDNNHGFGNISNVTLQGGSAYSGILASLNSSISSLDGVNISNFEYQVYAENLSTLNFTGDTILSNSTSRACFADDGGSVTFSSVSISGNNDVGAGLYASRGSRIIAEDCAISDCFDGVFATTGSYIDANSATISNCFYGCSSYYNSTVSAENPTLTNNTNDLFADYNGIVDAYNSNGSSSTNNGGVVFVH